MACPKPVVAGSKKLALTADISKFRARVFHIGAYKVIKAQVPGGMGVADAIFAAAESVPTAQPVDGFAHNGHDLHFGIVHFAKNVLNKPVIAPDGGMFQFGRTRDHQISAAGEG